VPTLEERVAYLEGKVEELSSGSGQLRQDVHALDQKVDRFREELSSRIDALDQKVDRFREELSSRIDALDRKVDRFREELVAHILALDQKVDRFREELSSRIDALDQKFSRQFAWLTGILVTALLAMLGIVGAALFRQGV
jgi:outer membrane murein-binding lipoprotein Lpp